MYIKLTQDPETTPEPTLEKLAGMTVLGLTVLGSTLLAWLYTVSPWAAQFLILVTLSVTFGITTSVNSCFRTARYTLVAVSIQFVVFISIIAGITYYEAGLQDTVLMLTVFADRFDYAAAVFLVAGVVTSKMLPAKQPSS